MQSEDLSDDRLTMRTVMISADQNDTLRVMAHQAGKTPAAYLRDNVVAHLSAKAEIARARQHPWDSFFESATNVAVGFFISLLTYAFIINPLFGLHTSPMESLGIVIVFTFISIARQYVLRRLFDGRSLYDVIRKKLA